MGDWTTDATDAIDRSITYLRERTVDPARRTTKVVVYLLLAALIAVPAVIMALIGVFRVVVIIEQGYVWAAWFTFGGIFMIAGGFCWTRANP
jgi:hypothetical protein